MNLKMNIEIESVYHLSEKKGVVFGAGITKGSSSTTGENVKAGKFPVLFYGYTKQQKKEQKTQKNNSMILKRVNTLLRKSKALSCVNQGNNNK